MEKLKVQSQDYNNDCMKDMDFGLLGLTYAESCDFLEKHFSKSPKERLLNQKDSFYCNLLYESWKVYKRENKKLLI